MLRSTMLALAMGASAVLAQSSRRSDDSRVGELPRSGVVVMGLPTAPDPVQEGGGPTGPNVNTTTNASPQNETTIALDPANPLNLIGGTNDYRNGDSQAGVAASFDGGRTWSATTLENINATYGKYGTQGDPAIAAYGGGVFYCAFIDFNRFDDQNRLGVAKTTDGGRTWPQVTSIVDHAGAGSHDFEDKEYIAVDGTGGSFDGNVYVSWTRFPVVGSQHIRFSRSTDGGRTWSGSIQISDSTSGYQGSVPAVGPNGEVYVAWFHSGAIEIDKSTDGGVTFGRDVTVAVITPLSFPLSGAFYRGNSFPTIGVDQGNGNVYVAWNDAAGVGGSGPDVLCSRSTDGGATWSAPVRVSDDVNRTTEQFFPWLAVEPNGAVDVVFYDRRDAPASQLFETYLARSTNGGVSFGANVRISDATSNAANDGFGGFFIGDYNGIAVASRRAHPLWTDCRAANANAEGYTVEYTFSQEVLVGSSPVGLDSNLHVLTASPFSTAIVGLTGVTALSGLDFAPDTGVLYGSTGNGDGGRLFTVDPDTAVGTLVGATGFAAVAGIVFDIDGTLYGSASLLGGVADTLIRINPATGAAVTVGAYGAGIGGIDALEIDFSTGNLIGTTGFFFDGTPGDVFVIDKGTGAARLIGSLTERTLGTTLGATLAGLTWVGSDLIGSLGGGDGSIIGIDLGAFTWTLLGDGTPGGGSISDLAYRPDQDCPSPALVASRNGGGNPASYTVGGSHGGRPVMGGTLDLFVNASGTTGHTNSTILGYLAPDTVTLARGQVLLLDVGDPNGEILGLPLQGGDTNLVGAPVPSDPALCGLTLYTQGLHILGVRPFALSNSQDLTVGGF